MAQPEEWVRPWEAEPEKGATAPASEQGPATVESAPVLVKERVESAVAVRDQPPWRIRQEWLPMAGIQRGRLSR
ncbi:hypothetical protein COMA2_50217 [Candidatus Nitrospira nitrificans]|uniref:Uncharacterized protein n=1 Tax=Candidatus Nitrospira nitrificans TaxID=1742973 RepID=A0A0S4LPS4_9BACT|nr:hypothetical protein COMA2_50217 [Candidatus Nitrospira nitrificans]